MRLLCSQLTVEFPAPQGRILALKNLSFNACEGEFVTLVGPSGCGKTTLLRALAEMVPPSGGVVERTPAPGEHDQPPLLVRQENSLFPWMTALENAAFGLEMRGVGREEREQRASAMLARFGLAGRERAWPDQLSRGMKQRVALVRAFLMDSPILLMDEPFAALDCQARMMAQAELLDYWQQDRRTIVFVTHDVEEAIFLSDRILVLSEAPACVVAEYEVPLPRPREALASIEATPYLKHSIFAALKLAADVATPECAR